MTHIHNLLEDDRYDNQKTPRKKTETQSNKKV